MTTTTAVPLEPTAPTLDFVYRDGVWYAQPKPAR